MFLFMGEHQMNRCQQPEPIEPDEILEWPPSGCAIRHIKDPFGRMARGVMLPESDEVVGYMVDWMVSVPELIKAVSVQFAEKKQLELRANLLEIVLAELKSRIEQLESNRSIIVPINTFSPEPYDILKPILVSVHAVEDEYEAGWHDANIHTSGENEEEAVSNLKSLILDIFEIFSNEPTDKLGPEPKRQMEILKQFIQKKP
jgi:hypothetical protein